MFQLQCPTRDERSISLKENACRTLAHRPYSDAVNSWLALSVESGKKAPGLWCAPAATRTSFGGRCVAFPTEKRNLPLDNVRIILCAAFLLRSTHPAKTIPPHVKRCGGPHNTRSNDTQVLLGMHTSAETPGPGAHHPADPMRVSRRTTFAPLPAVRKLKAKTPGPSSYDPAPGLRHVRAGRPSCCFGRASRGELFPQQRAGEASPGPAALRVSDLDSREFTALPAGAFARARRFTYGAAAAL